ncbi:MAG: tetratricopeptide repeat protein [Proteobacteria bacterium]|nr:tetratricopeptide repeat protein [Pseudomonadota bacterium]
MTRTMGRVYALAVLGACAWTAAPAQAEDTPLAQCRALLAKPGQESPPGTLAACDAAVAADPKSPLAYMARGQAKVDAGDFAGALADASTAMLLDPSKPSYATSAGDIAAAMGQHKQAIGFYDAALKADPANLKALTSRGDSYFKLKDYAQAKAAFDQAVQVHPENAQSWHMRGHAKLFLKDYPGAAADFAKALSITPNSADLLTDSGDTARMQKQPQQAIDFYTRAMAADPKFLRAVQSRAVTRAEQKQDFDAYFDMLRATAIGGGPDYAKAAEVMKANFAFDHVAPLNKAGGALYGARRGEACRPNTIFSLSYSIALTHTNGDIPAAEAYAVEEAMKPVRECIEDNLKAQAELPKLRVQALTAIAEQAKRDAALEPKCRAPEAQPICTAAREASARSVKNLKQRLSEVEASFAPIDTAAAEAEAKKDLAQARADYIANNAKQRAISRHIAIGQTLRDSFRATDPKRIFDVRDAYWDFEAKAGDRLRVTITLQQGGTQAPQMQDLEGEFGARPDKMVYEPNSIIARTAMRRQSFTITRSGLYRFVVWQDKNLPYVISLERY